LRAALKCWGGRRLCVTTKGYVGAVTPLAEVGDEIVVFAGMQTPSVLRRVDNKQYQFVGECYVHGLMNGEALHPTFSRRDFEIV